MKRLFICQATSSLIGIFLFTWLVARQGIESAIRGTVFFVIAMLTTSLMTIKELGIITSLPQALALLLLGGIFIDFVFFMIMPLLIGFILLYAVDISSAINVEKGEIFKTVTGEFILFLLSLALAIVLFRKGG